MTDLGDLKVIVFKEDLEIHYCDPITLEPVKIITLDDLEAYLYSR